jgi:DNA-binding NarL/FixJ family response regulator
MSQTGPIATSPMLVTDGKGSWRLDVPWRARKKETQPTPITSVRVRAMMAMGLDTMQIAAELKTTEATVWNALARAGA